MVSQAELILRVITLWFLVLFQFFRDGMGPFNDQIYLEAQSQGQHHIMQTLVQLGIRQHTTKYIKALASDKVL